MEWSPFQRIELAEGFSSVIKESILYLLRALNPVAFQRDRAKQTQMIKKIIKYLRIAMNPVNPVAFEVDRARLRAELQKVEEAKLQAQAKQKRLRDAVSEYAAGELEAAETFVEEVSPEDPAYGVALTLFARAAMKRKDYAQALRWWEAKLASQRGDLAPVLIGLSVAYSRQGMLDKAINLLNSAQECGLADGPLRFQLARFLGEEMEWGKAADLVSTIIAEDETFAHNARFAIFAALVFWRVGDPSRANAVIDQAITEDNISGLSLPAKAFVREIRRRFRSSSKLNSVELSQAYYDDIFRESQEYAKDVNESVFRNTWDEVASRIEQGGYVRILDIGCGPGQFAEHLIRRCPSVEYTGVDFSKVAISAAKERCPSVAFIEADIFQTDILEKGEYDLVVALELLEHLENDLALLNKIPVGKKVMFSVPNSDAFAHIRFFPSEEAVTERYSSCLSDLQVMPITLANQQVTFFIFGVRK